MVHIICSEKKNEFMTMSFLCILFLLSKITYFAFDVKIIICWEKFLSVFFSDHTISDIKQSVKILLALDFLRQTPQDNVRTTDWPTIQNGMRKLFLIKNIETYSFFYFLVKMLVIFFLCLSHFYTSLSIVFAMTR